MSHEVFMYFAMVNSPYKMSMSATNVPELLNPYFPKVKKLESVYLCFLVMTYFGPQTHSGRPNTAHLSLFYRLAQIMTFYISQFYEFRCLQLILRQCQIYSFQSSLFSLYSIRKHDFFFAFGENLPKKRYFVYQSHVRKHPRKL